MSVLSIISRINGGIIEFNTGSIANPVEFQGLLLDTEGAVYATIEAPEYFENGLGFKDGALCVIEAPYENISSGLPFLNGSLCVSSGNPTHYNNGIPFGEGGISSGGLNPPIFNGTYAFYPFATNGNNTVTAGVKINERLGDKIFSNDSGNLVTVGEYETAYTGSGELDEPSATNGVTFTDDVNGNGWVKQGAGTAINGTDGEIELDFSLPDTSFRLYQVEPPHTGDACAQVYVKAFDGESGDYVISMQESSNVITGDAVTIDDSKWYLAYASGQFNGASAASIYFGRGDRGQTLSRVKIKYPQYVEGTLYPSSPIYNPTNAPATRDSDKAAVPTSDVWVDGGCFSGTLTSGSFNNGVSRTSNSEFTIAFDGDGKYAGKITAAVIGSVLLNNPQFTVTLNVSNSRVRASHNNLTEQELIDLFGNDGTSTNKYPIAFQYSTLTLAEVTQLRADVGDTPPTEYPDGSFRWLDWPAVDVVFQLDFTLYSNDPNELFHIEWANAAKDTYVARTGDSLEFNHGNDTLTIPYANLIVLGDTYKGYAVITPTELIGYVNGVEVARMTRTDTALAEWSSKCYFGGFNNTLAPVKLANLKVFDYVAPPPVGNLIVSDASSLTGDPNSTGYATASFSGGSDVGSLSPPVSIGGVLLEGIYSNNVDIGDGTKKYIFMGDPNGLIEGRVDATFNGVTYEFDSLFGAGSPPGIQSDSLYDFLLANQNTPIDFTAEATAPVGSQLIVGDFSPISGTAGDSALLPDGALGSLLPPVLVDGLAINFIQSVFFDFGDGAKKWVLCGNNTQDFTTNLTLTFNGTSYSLVRGAIALNPNTNAIQSDALYDFLTANQNVSVDFTAEATAPVGSQLIVEDFSAQGGVGASIFDTGQLTGTAAGSLTPPISLGSLGNIYAIVSSSNTLPNKLVALQIDNTAPDQTINATFNGQSYIFTFNPSIGYAVESDALYDFLTANQNTPIVFTAEVATDFADNGDFANNGDFA